MKIVCYINKISHGGAERVMSVLANHLVSRGHEVILVVDYNTDNQYKLDSRIDLISLEGRFVKGKSAGGVRSFISRIRKIRHIIKETEADIIISFIREVNFRALLATVFTRTKNLISVRIDPKRAYKNRAIELLAKILYSTSDGCVFQTPEAQSFYPYIIRRKSKVLYNPVSKSFFDVTRDCFEKTIVTCGRLVSQKNHSVLINAFSKLDKAFDEFKLLIYGEGELKEELECQIKKLGIEGKVKLMGRCDDIPNAIKNASLFVLSSDFEGLPNSLMEAMALGLPCVSTDCGGGGARFLIEDMKNGLLVKCNDTDEMKNALEKCLKDKDFANRISLNARKTAGDFSVEKIIDKWENYIKEIIE